MICVRLKEDVSFIVAENQEAFVQGKSLVHNVLIVMKDYTKMFDED